MRPDVTLHVQDALAIDFQFPIGAAVDIVVGKAGAPLVNTTLATVSTVVAQTFVEHMSLNGRSCQTLIMLETHMVVTQTAFKHQEPELGRWLPDCSMFAAEE